MDGMNDKTLYDVKLLSGVNLKKMERTTCTCRPYFVFKHHWVAKEHWGDCCEQ